MKRYAAVKVRGASAPGAGCWKGAAGRGRFSRSFRLIVSLERR